MDQEEIENWIIDATIGGMLFGWIPTGISVHNHVFISFITGKEIRMSECHDHKLEPAQ